MTDRRTEIHHATASDLRPTGKAGSRPGRARRRPRRPVVERLDGRTLMSYGGGLDFTFGSSGVANYVVPPGSSYAAIASVDQGGKTVVVGTISVPDDPAKGTSTRYFAASR